MIGPIICGPALAQSEPEIVDVGEVIVTAQKRSESVQKVPASITAISSATLQERGVTQASDLQFMVPNVHIGKMTGTTAVTIRGVGLNQGAPGVAIHVDGVYQPTPQMGDLAQVDIERVEVLRGPQGTLYGRNANGGVINFITKGPTNEFEGYAQASYASYNETRLQAVVNIPVNDRVRARAVLDWQDRQEGFVKNVIPGGQDLDKFNTLSGRLRVNADLTEALILDLNLSQVHSSGPANYFNLNARPTAASIVMNPYLANATVPLRPWRTSVNDPVSSSRNSTLAAATLTWDLGDLQAKSITGWQRAVNNYLGDNDSFDLSAFPRITHSRSETLTQELNVSGSLGPLDAVVGLFLMDDQQYERSQFDFPLGIFPLPPGSQLVSEAYKYSTRTAAVFTDATWNVSERFRLFAGLRHSKDKQRLTQRNFLTFGPTALVTTCPLQANEVEFRSTTPRAGAQYELSPSSNLYVTVSKGFKVGGFNTAACNQTFNPEKINAYETGVKSRLLDNTLTLNLSAFYYDYTDLQLQQTVGLTSRITNAAAAEVKGVELEAIWQPDGHWTVNANLSLLDATYKDFQNVDTLAPALGVQDVSGNRLNSAPKESANLGASYRTDPLEFGRLTFRADVSQRSKQYFREFNNPLDSQPGYTLLNLAVIWDSPDGAYRIRGFATNVTDEDYFVRMGSADQIGARFITWGPPRQVGVELRANF